MTTWQLHPQLAADTLLVGDFARSRLLLMNDAQYLWCILVPRIVGAKELYKLDDADQLQVLRESVALSRAMAEMVHPHKMNIAALGNVVAQLHIHHIARFKTDPAWPAPVWGKLPAQPYQSANAADRIAALRQALPGLS